MRILMLSCNTGEGHNSTAKAIADALEQHGVASEIQDVLCCLSPKFSKFICNWHVRLYRYAPRLFDASYRVIERSTGEQDEWDSVYEVLALGAEKLRRLLEAGDYDGVICVHVFSGMMMTEVRRRWNVKVPCFFVATDYSCVPFTDQCNMDYYFIPDQSLVPEYVAAGLPRARLVPSGIPIRRAFYSKEPKADARKALNLPAEGPVVLLMCGSMGCGPMRKIAKGMLERIPVHGKVVTVCGNNEKLYQSLSDLTSSRFRVLGFTREISRYMDASDLIVTKPGGLSSTEAANKHLPMVFINAVGGCEARNFELFLQKGYAVGSKNAEEVLDLVGGLMRSPERLARMEQLLAQDFTINGADVIATRTIDAAEAYRNAT